MTIVTFNLMTNKKGNLTVPLAQTVVLIHLVKHDKLIKKILNNCSVVTKWNSECMLLSCQVRVLEWIYTL